MESSSRESIAIVCCSERGSAERAALEYGGPKAAGREFCCPYDMAGNGGGIESEGTAGEAIAPGKPDGGAMAGVASAGEAMAGVASAGGAMAGGAIEGAGGVEAIGGT